MAHFLYRLGRTAYRKWPIFLLTWLIAAVGLGTIAATQARPMTNQFTIPGIPSLQAAQTQKSLFPGQKAADKQVPGQLVLKAPAGKTLDQEPYKSQVDQLVKRVAKQPQMPKTPLANPVDAAASIKKQMEQAGKQQAQQAMKQAQQQAAQQAAKQAGPNASPQEKAAILKAAQQKATQQVQQKLQAEQKKAAPQQQKMLSALSPLSSDKRIGVVTWNFDVDNPMDIKPETQEAIRKDAAAASKNGLTVVTGGMGMQEMVKPGTTSELIGIGIALVVLVLTFGSIVAAGMPIINAIVGLIVGLMGVTASTMWFDLPETTTSLASMIGLAVGIDYALFILSRYRAELRHTDERAHAMGRALGTAGSAVVFAGLTVIIALSAFTVLGIGMLTAMGLGAAFTVFMAVMVSLTLLPAIMGMLKGKAFAGRVRKDKAADEFDHNSTNGSVRLGRGIAKAPWAVALACVALLVALAVPVKGLHLGLPSDATAQQGTDARRSADILAEGFGAGKNAPMVAVIDGRNVPGDAQAKQAAYQAYASEVGQDKNVANATVVQQNKTGDGAVLLVTPETGPADVATDELLTRLRDAQPAFDAKHHTKIGITGQTAIAADVSQRLQDALPKYLAIVVGLAFILLVVVFRSLIVPALATLGFLLSVLATLGVTVKLVQDGLFGFFDPQPIMSFMPTLLIGIVFGLAMDYQVFLTTRMRESYSHGMNARDAVIDGFRHSGRVVTAAALIMISVFAAFAAQDNALIKTIGVALATAVLLDAFIVRMVLVPAIMLMIGKGSWWMPKWLDKIVPNVDVEGESLAQYTNAATSAVHAGAASLAGNRLKADAPGGAKTGTGSSVARDS